MTTRRSIASLATTATAALALTSAASAFPDKLLQFVTPYPFGGSHALHASIITTAAEPHFGQPMMSVIRTGGGGVVGADYVLKSAADGHVMLFGDPNLNSLRPQVEQLSFSVGDFIPVARINYSPWVFVAKPDAPFGGTIKGMADWAKANPDKLIYSSDNVNGPTHIVFLLMEQKTGAKMWPLQLGGGGPAITNLLDSNTMAYAGDPSVVGEHILGGKLRGLCVVEVLEPRDGRGRRGRREHELPAGIDQAVEEHEQLVLRPVLGGDEVDVVEQERGRPAVARPPGARPRRGRWPRSARR